VNPSVASGDVVRERTVTVDEVDLFLFSAACWLPHRIHYDKAFAVSEGLSDVPVHGPLQAAWLSQLADEWAREHGRVLRRFSVRHLASGYPNQALRCVVAHRSAADSAHPLDSADLRVVPLTVWVEGPDGVVLTTGSAQAELPEVSLR
jgi:hydroxyacyl-ACP dehydratase HTD2-like protein with hotdog domain